MQNDCSRAPGICPLSQVTAGTTVRIKRLTAPHETTHRLREIGFCEERQIKVISRESCLFCLVCNARLGISVPLADMILVEPMAGTASTL